MSGRRKIGIGMDYSGSSKAALRWAVHNIVGEGDLLVIIDVQSSKSDFPQKKLWESTGSPLIPLNELKESNSLKQYGLGAPDPEVLDILETVSNSKKAQVVAKIYWGDPRDKLCDAVEELELGPLKGVLLGSVSNYVVTNAACAVTVVKEGVADKD
ncbi:hypothetical protein EJ110_NYTH05354 [Nymphaea thermarum]|nr:hypothetical protein EJ110_NYTH05354 [Nymphaea thermarum]